MAGRLPAELDGPQAVSSDSSVWLYMTMMTHAGLKSLKPAAEPGFAGATKKHLV